MCPTHTLPITPCLFNPTTKDSWLPFCYGKKIQLNPWAFWIHLTFLSPDLRRMLKWQPSFGTTSVRTDGGKQHWKMHFLYWESSASNILQPSFFLPVHSRMLWRQVKNTAHILHTSFQKSSTIFCYLRNVCAILICIEMCQQQSKGIFKLAPLHIQMLLLFRSSNHSNTRELL